jgi:signal transduction histidine kinase
LLKGGIDQKLNELIEVAVADETAEVIRIYADAAQLLSRLERISQIHAALAILTTLALVILLLRGLRAPLAQLLRGTAKLAEGELAYRIAIPGHDVRRSRQQLQSHGEICRASSRPPDAHQSQIDRRRALNCVRRTIPAQGRRDAAGLFADISHELRTPLTIIRGEARSRCGAPMAGRRVTLDRADRRAGEAPRCSSAISCSSPARVPAPRASISAVDLGNLVEKVCGDARVIAHARLSTSLSPAPMSMRWCAAIRQTQAIVPGAA